MDRNWALGIVRATSKHEAAREARQLGQERGFGHHFVSAGHRNSDAKWLDLTHCGVRGAPKHVAAALVAMVLLSTGFV